MFQIHIGVFKMVNSGSLGLQRENANENGGFSPTSSLTNDKHSSSPIMATSPARCKNEFSQITDSDLPYETHAIEPVATNTEIDSADSLYNVQVASLFCSVPLDKVQTILSMYSSSKGEKKAKRKVLCLFCDRTFVNEGLKQKHVDRCHSSKQMRRISLRRQQNPLTSTPCGYCDRLTSTDHTLKELFEHQVRSHSDKYFGCLPCEERFLNSSLLANHMSLTHRADSVNESMDFVNKEGILDQPRPEGIESTLTENQRTLKKKVKFRGSRELLLLNPNHSIHTKEGPATSDDNVKYLRSKKLLGKNSKIVAKRSKRLQERVIDPQKRRRTKTDDKKERMSKPDNISKLVDKSSKKSIGNPYPEFDSLFRVKKITDHSIDNLKIGCLTFDDVFDKAFYNRITSNIQENLLNHIDGKLFKNEESESRISNFEKISSLPQEVPTLSSENYGCELSLNAVAPTTSLLSSQFGEDPESQIEYGSKPSKKKTNIKSDEVHYKYFTRRKYQAIILERKENRDMSKLDMWTQFLVKSRQQKILDDKKGPKEILEYLAGNEYKNKIKKDELNRILDRRGPFEDLREEASKMAALDKLNLRSDSQENDNNIYEISNLVNDLLDKICATEARKSYSTEFATQNTLEKKSSPLKDNNCIGLPSYLNLRRTSSLPSDSEIDKSDRITLICSSQETENFELPTNTVRRKNEKVELTGEWARARIYICAACGLKLQNIKQLLEHKSVYHQNVWVQHYEFVGNQSELCKHLCIPALGKVGLLNKHVQYKAWKRSDARLCTKCGKQCNSLGELHRHILECGGDWTWMLARKKCKYRPFGAKSRRKRRGEFLPFHLLVLIFPKIKAMSIHTLCLNRFN